MQVGIGLPNAIADTTGEQLTEWARAAEQAGFSSLGTIDRIVYDSYESIVALSAAAFDGGGELEAKVGPRPKRDGPTLLVDGGVQASLDRAAKYADGWTQGGSGPNQFKEDVAELEQAWKAAGRDGSPYKMALIYFSLGPDAQKNAEHDLGDYYAWVGEEIAELIVGSAAKDADEVQEYISAFEDHGCDELIFFPAASDPEQVTLLADAAGV